MSAVPKHYSNEYCTGEGAASMCTTDQKFYKFEGQVRIRALGSALH